MSDKTPNAWGEAESIHKWHDLLLGLIESFEDENDLWLAEERAAVDMLAYLASGGKRSRLAS